jgi:hypothetical protein
MDHDTERGWTAECRFVRQHEAILYYLTHAWTVARQYGREVLEIAYNEMRHRVDR